VVSKVLVKDGDFVSPRAPLLEMYDPGSLVIRFAVPEAQATEVFKGMPVNVHLDAHPDKDTKAG
jgi:membrane fusion protein (multidrug efflux system)